MAGRRRLNRMSPPHLDLLPLTMSGGGGGRGGFGTTVAAGGEGRRRSFAQRVLARTGVPLNQIEEGAPEDLTSPVLLFDLETNTYIVPVGYPDEDEYGNAVWPPEALRKVTLRANPRKKKLPSLSPRSTVAMAHSLRGGAGAGKHHTRARDVRTGRSRKPKHGGKRALSEMRENPDRYMVEDYRALDALLRRQSDWDARLRSAERQLREAQREADAYYVFSGGLSSGPSGWRSSILAPLARDALADFADGQLPGDVLRRVAFLAEIYGASSMSDSQIEKELRRAFRLSNPR